MKVKINHEKGIISFNNKEIKCNLYILENIVIKKN